MFPIFLNNASPNAFDCQQLGSIAGGGSSDTKQRAIAEYPECRSSSTFGLCQTSRTQCLLYAIPFRH
jgi:hypothetical protein